MFGGMSGAMSIGSYHRNRPEPRKLSPEEEATLLEKKRAEFLIDLEKSEVERKKNFPKWKQYSVYGLMITASNEKNAIRDMGFILKRNSLSIA